MNQEIIKQIGRLAGEGIPFLLIVDFEMQKPQLFPLSELPDDVFFQVPGGGREQPLSDAPDSFKFHKHPVEYKHYRESFRIVRENTLAGNTYLTNLTFPTDISSDLDLGSIYRISRAKYKLLYRNEFVVFSPETFIHIRGGKIFSYPMKGTIDADIPDARRILLEDEKEMAEHVTIVDLIRNDMSIHAKHVKVEKFRFVDRLETSDKTLLQVSSEISGELPHGYESSLGEILFSMLPAGSVSGAPKKETLRIIREAEGGSRGYYTGIMGYFDGHDFDSAVLIRFIENEKGRLIYRSGGGITSMSDPEKEYQELIDKVYVPLI